MDADALREIITRLDRIEVALQSRTVTTEVLTRLEAKKYVKRRSEGAFCEWCKRWSVRPAFRGRYSRAQLDVALGREARVRR